MTLISTSTKLSPCGPYSNDRTGNSNAVVNARQKKVNTDYHSRAESLDARGGDTRDGFEAELNSYGQGGRVLGPVVGAFGEMSDDVKELANAVAEELAVEHCSFYGIRCIKRSKASSSTRTTAPGDILPTADRHGSSSTAVVWCRFPMPHAVGHAQTTGTTTLRGEYHGEPFPPGGQSPHWLRALDRALS